MKRYMQLFIFLSVSIFLLTIILGFVYMIDNVQKCQDDMFYEIESLNDILETEREKITEIKQRNEELELMLFNFNRMKDIYLGSRTGLLSRGNELTFIAMPLTLSSGFSASRFNRIFKGGTLEGIGDILIRVEAEYGINALVLAGIIVHETGWGESRLAKDKNNLAGLGAYDGQAYSAGFTFNSKETSIVFLANLLTTHYAKGGKYYGGSYDLNGVNVNYATDTQWALKVAKCMTTIIAQCLEN